MSHDYILRINYFELISVFITIIPDINIQFLITQIHA